MQNNNLVCGTGVTTATVFVASSAGKLENTANGGDTWYAASVPSGSTQVTVGTAQAATGLVIEWKGA